MSASKKTINDRMSELIKEMISLDIKYVDASEEFEKLFIREVLNCNGYNRSDAAKKLGMHRNTLTYKIKKFKLS
jgi:transcriptional regulator with PAS, ATPase and Fis domain